MIGIGVTQMAKKKAPDPAKEKLVKAILAEYQPKSLIVPCTPFDGQEK